MRAESVEVPGCVGTCAQMLAVDTEQHIMRVTVQRGGVIPLHTHECAATMVVVKGSAQALGLDQRVVSTGDVVVKRPNEPHGFSDVTEDFEFISISGGRGIRRGQEHWDLTYVSGVDE